MRGRRPEVSLHGVLIYMAYLYIWRIKMKKNH